MSKQGVISKGWTPEDDATLKEYYPLEGSACFSRLEHKTKDACYKRVSRLGIKCDNRNYTSDKIGDNGRLWTKDEDKIIINYYPIEGSECYKRLENRSKASCTSRWSRLPEEIRGTKGSWTETEDELIRMYYPRIGSKVSRLMKYKTATECSSRASKLGVVKDNKIVS